MADLVTIYSSNIPVDCHILKGRLEAEGITCFVFDENIVGIHPFRAVAVGGVKLKVPADQAVFAFEVMKSIEKGDFMQDPGEIKDSETHGEAVENNREEKFYKHPEKKEVICPGCGSANTSFGYAIDNKWNIPYLILSLLVLIPFFPFRKKYHCFNCGLDFHHIKIK